MLIGDVLKAKGSGCETLQPNNRVATAVKVLAERGIGAVVVTETDGRLVGIFSERDLVKLLARDGAAGLEHELRDAMTRPVVTGRPGDRIEDAMAVMTQHHIRHLPVIEAGRLAGMVSIRDLVRRRLSEKELEAAVLLDRTRLHE